MIQADASGFLLGNQRLKEISEGVTKTEDNTEQILDFLKGETLKLIEEQAKHTNAIQKAIESMVSANKSSKNAENSPSKQHRGAVDASASNRSNTAIQEQIQRSQAQDAERATETSRRTNRSNDATDPNLPISTNRNRSNAQPSPSSAEERASLERQDAKGRNRDSNGRFTAKEKSLFSKMQDIFKGGGASGALDGKGLDPTVDALNELKEFVSPVSRIFGRMSAKAASVFTGRLRKDADKIPEEQRDANRRDQDASAQRNRLLQKLIDAVRSNANNGGGISGFFGGLFKKGGGLLKGLIKRLPLIGGLVGGGLLAKDWDGLDTGGKGEGIGNIVGGIVGAAVGSFFSPVGTVVGGGLGVYLGGIFGKKVAEWTNGLKNINFIGAFVDLWEKALAQITEFAKSVIKNPIQAGKDAYNGAKSWGSRLYSGAVDKIQGFGESVSNLWNGTDSNSSAGLQAGTGQLKHQSTDTLGKYKPIADAVSMYESKGSYTIANTGGYEKRRVKGDFQTKDVSNLTNMSINDILKRNSLPVGHADRLNAVGRYQIIASNLRNWVNSGQLDGNAKFTPELQDKLFLKLMPKQLKDYADGKNVSASEAQNATAKIWAAVPRTDTGRSHHAGVGLNKSHANAGNVLQQGMNASRNGVPIKQNTAPTITPASATIITPNQATPKGAKALADFATNAPMPVSNVRAQVITPFKPPTMQASNVAKVAPVTAEMNSITPVLPRPKTQAQQDTMIAQNVSDRGLAHILTGGIGFRSA